MIVKGAHNFYLNKKKITKPDIVIDEKKKYIEQISYVQNFINEKRKSNEKFSYVNSIHDPINLQSEIHSTN